MLRSDKQNLTKGRHMARGTPGAHLIPWSHTLIDGMSGGPVARLENGVSWSWVGSHTSLIINDETCERFGLQEAALHAARQYLGGSANARLDVAGDILTERTFTVSDGAVRYEAILLELAELARPLVLFPDGLPPQDTLLRVVECFGSDVSINRLTEEPTGVICFTKGTRLLTPDGPRLVEDLAEGDQVVTKDDGTQDILWIGSRRMSGARLHAMPELRPIRLRSGVINGDSPEPDLIVSPRHRIVLKGDFARALFGTPEVLVTARDLMDDRGILIDHSLSEVTYVHILLPKHEIVWANGVETESFHPASTDLATISDEQRSRLLTIKPGIDADPARYGAPARKPLSADEAAIFGADTAKPH